MPTDIQYKDGLRKDRFLNDLIIEAIKNGDTKKHWNIWKKITNALKKHWKNNR